MNQELPLHSAAAGILLGQRLDPDFAGYWTAECVELTGPVDVPRLVAAIAATVVAAEPLHVRIVGDPDTPRQRIGVDPRWQPTVVDLPDADRETVLADIARQLGTAADPTVDRLVRSTVYVGTERVWWLLQTHHLVLDGYGYSLIMRQVAARYRNPSQPGNRFAPLSDLVEHDLAYHSGDQHAVDRHYWTRLLAGREVTGFSPDIALPGDRVLRHELALPATALADVGPTWPHRLLAAVAATLHRRTGEECPVLGLPMAGRLGTPTARVPGMVMNINPVPVPIGIGEDLTAVTGTVAARLRASRPHQQYRYEQLRGDLHTGAGAGRIFSPVVNIIPFGAPPDFGTATVRLHHISAGPVDDLAITARDPHHLTIEANPALYDATTIADIGAELVAVLTGDRPASPWQALPCPASPAIRPVTELVADHATRYPDRAAVIDGDRHLDYRTLWGRSGAAADWLARRGVIAGDLVALRLPRGAEAIVAMLALRRLGAGYLPVDPDGPADRNAALLSETAPRLVLEPGMLPDATAERVDVAVPAAPGHIIHTSGSTGTPKAVVVPAAAVDHFATVAVARYDWRPTDRILQFAPLHFDTHVEEIFGGLAVGATVVVRDGSATRSLSEFTDFVAEAGISILDLPTAYWRELVWAVWHRRVRLPGSVRQVVIGGEAADPTTVDRWHQRVGTDIELVNSYGPTEATVVCVSTVLRPGEPVALGTPLPGVATALGPRNELYLAGPGLADGYLHGPDPAFVTVDGQRWYRTGDRVEWRDGRLYYRGRVDDQVKIAGHRVHPAEVEAVLSGCDGVAELAVVPTGPAHQRRLVAHLVGAATETELRAHARSRLPAAAVPTGFTRHDRLPRNRSGKIDRAALATAAPTAAPPADGVVGTVLAVFTEVLGQAPADADTDFFAAGGTSLAAVAAANRLGVALDRDVTAAQLFNHPSAAELAAALSGAADTDDRELLVDDTDWRPATTTGGVRAPVPVADDAPVALTGASGFVGAHLLAGLLAHRLGPVRCLLRGDHDRLAAVLTGYGLPTTGLDRVEIVAGDLSRPDCGLDSAGRRQLADCRAVVHCAADVGFARGYRSLRQVNVLAVRSLLELTGDAGGHFHHISTVAVAGGRDLPEDFVPDHGAPADGYQLSKWGAEELLRRAARSGRPVSVHRLGRVVAPAGAPPNPADLVVRLVQASRTVGAVPDLAIREPWIAADTAARCIAALVAEPQGNVMNLVPHPAMELTRVWRAVCDADPGLQSVSLSEWRDRLAAATEDPRITVLRGFFAIHHDGPPADHRVRTDRFRSWLDRSGVSVPEPDPAAMRWQ